MSRRVLWFLFYSLMITVHGLDNCLPAREAYVNLNLGDAEDVPVNFTSGIDARICAMTSLTCCPLEVEQAMDNAAFANTRNMIPPYSLYLNESDRVFFVHYGYVTDVVIEAIRDYFELSVPAGASNIQSAMNRMTRQLNNIHNINTGSNFPDRMKDLFSYSYLERMRGLYNLDPNNEYNNTFTNCALSIIEQGQISDEILSAIDAMEYHFRSLFYYREVIFGIYDAFITMKRDLPFIQCVRSFAELFYCHICLPETSSLFPCRNVCKNVISGCTIFLHVIGEEMTKPLRALCQLNTMTNDPLWNLHTALETLNNKLYSIFDTPIGELLQIASNISSCNEAPVLDSSPTPTNNPDRTTSGRVELLSQVPTSLIESLHNTLITNLSSMFLGFENITHNILESECGSLPESDRSPDFECWHRRTGSTTDVNYLGIDFQAVLYNNQDLQPPDASFVNDFNASIDYMKANATQAMRFVEAIPADMMINMDRCNLSLGELLLLPPVITSTMIGPSLTASIVITSTMIGPSLTARIAIPSTTIGPSLTAIIDMPMPNNSSSSSDTNAIIIGGAVGGVILLLIIITIVLYSVILCVRMSCRKEKFHVYAYDQVLYDRTILNTGVTINHNPSYDVTNTNTVDISYKTRGPNINSPIYSVPHCTTNEEEHNYECDQSLNLNDTVKSYGVCTVENKATVFSTTVMNSDIQDHQPSDSSHDHNHYDYIHDYTAQLHHNTVTTATDEVEEDKIQVNATVGQSFNAITSPPLITANEIKSTEDVYGVINQPPCDIFDSVDEDYTTKASCTPQLPIITSGAREDEYGAINQSQSDDPNDDDIADQAHDAREVWLLTSSAAGDNDRPNGEGVYGVINQPRCNDPIIIDQGHTTTSCLPSLPFIANPIGDQSQSDDSTNDTTQGITVV